MDAVPTYFRQYQCSKIAYTLQQIKKEREEEKNDRSRSRSNSDRPDWDAGALVKNAALLEAHRKNMLEWTALGYVGRWLTLDAMATSDDWEELCHTATRRVSEILEEHPSAGYYIGITGDIPGRWLGVSQLDGESGRHKLLYRGHHERWLQLFVIAWQDGPVIGRLEKATLATFLSQPQCANTATGNQRPCPKGVLSYMYLALEEIDSQPQ